MAENKDVEMFDLDFVDTDVKELTQNKYKNYVFVDIQGFKISRYHLMCKEFCLVDGDFIYHKLVKSYYKIDKMAGYYRRQANWLTNNFHKIRYDCGDIHINELKKIVYPQIQNKTILVKGAQKICWLERIFGDCGPIQCENVEELDDFDLTLKNSEPYNLCDYHEQVHGIFGGPCALATALMLKDLFTKNTN